MTETCVDKTKYLQDAEIHQTAAEAYSSNVPYYRNEIYKATIVRPQVKNAAGAVERAEMIFDGDSMCFTGIIEPNNSGKVSFGGTLDSYFLILKPSNYAGSGSDGLVITNGSATVLGGFSEGAITASTKGKLEIYSVMNSGQVTVSGSTEIFIGNVTNTGKLTTIDVSATLIDIDNSGDVEVNGPSAGGRGQGGYYSAYNIVNTGSITIGTGAVSISGENIVNEGTITIRSGVVSLSFTCPQNGHLGSLDIKEGVTGTITYKEACKGVMTVPDTVSQVVITEAPTPAPPTPAPPTVQPTAEPPTSAAPTATPPDSGTISGAFSMRLSACVWIPCLVLGAVLAMTMA
jgi:hypothetical protein